MEKGSFINTVRKPKIFNMAVFDIVATAASGVLALWVLSEYSSIEFNTLNLIIVEFIIFSVGVIVHRVFNIPTMGNYYLGLNDIESVYNNRNKN